MFEKNNDGQEINASKNTQGTPFWQSRFHDRVIRNEKELNRIREYIFNNPANWENDCNKQENGLES